MQFKGYKKLSDARWFPEEEVREKYAGVLREWERKKKTYGVDHVERKSGMMVKLKRK